MLLQLLLGSCGHTQAKRLYCTVVPSTNTHVDGLPISAVVSDQTFACSGEGTRWEESSFVLRQGSSGNTMVRTSIIN